MGTRIVLGQSGLAIFKLGGGVGMNYRPPIGDDPGGPDPVATFGLKALVDIGTLDGKAMMGRVTMVYAEPRFSLNGKLWVMGMEDNCYGEGQIDRPLRMRINSTDTDFLDVYQIPLLAGRNYSSTALSGGEPYSRMVYNQPYSDVVINRTAARQLGWEDPVGKRLIWVHDAKRQVTCLIVGLMEDFHTESLGNVVDDTCGAFNP